MPISLLSVIANTLEKSFHSYITANVPNTPTQHGYKTQHSTVAALPTLNNTAAKGFSQMAPPARTITVTLDMTKSFNIINIHTTSLALSYSEAEYAATVWARSAHTYKLDSELNIICRAIMGCLKPTNIEELYLLSGIAPLSITRDVCARAEKDKQETNEAHCLYGQIPVERLMKSMKCFLHSVKHANLSPKVIRNSEWLRRTNNTPHRTSVNLDHSQAREAGIPFTMWRCLKYSKAQRKKLQYFDGDTPCECYIAYVIYVGVYVLKPIHSTYNFCNVISFLCMSHVILLCICSPTQNEFFNPFNAKIINFKNWIINKVLAVWKTIYLVFLTFRESLLATF